MITRIALDLTDDERRQISGKSRPATRKEINQFFHRLMAATLQRGEQALPAVTIRADRDETERVTITSSALDCTTLDHLYPLGEKTADTKCFCGKRAWGGVR